MPYVTLAISKMGVLRVCGWEGGSEFSRRGLLSIWVRCRQLARFAGCRSAADRLTHRVTPAAHGSVAGTLAVGSGVHADETIGTDKGGVAGLRFHDQSTLDVGPNSSVRLNKFIYNSNRSGGKASSMPPRVRYGSRPARRAAIATFRSRPRLGRSVFAAEVNRLPTLRARDGYHG